MKPSSREYQRNKQLLVNEMVNELLKRQRLIDLMLDFIADLDCIDCPLYIRCKRGEFQDPERCRDDILDEFKQRI